ncbi:MAG: penicillin-binding transpeptidase domain-containing protein [Terriglobales bacterium]
MALREFLNDPKRRLYLLGGILFLWCGGIGLRLVQLQIVRYGDWMQRAQRQQQRTIEVAPRRGIIYDRNGHELAMSISVDSVFAVPSEIPDPENTASLLARVLHSDPGEIMARLKASRSFAWIARKVDADAGQRIRGMNLRGIYFQKEPKRFYPKRELAAQTIGYVGMDDEGLGGIEHAFEPRLRGTPGKMLITMDARRKWFGRVERQPDAGENVVLTIDEKIQYIVERELDKAMQDTRAAAGMVIVQNPRTGEILALANRPTFNPNLYKDAGPAALKNRAVSDIFEPGSVFKMVTYSSALEEKLAKPEDPIDCQGGVITVGGIKIHDLHKMGVVTIAEAIAHSSDVAAVKVGMRLGDDRFYNYIHSYGFGQQTGIELPGETRGMAKPANRWSKVSIGAISIGQEIGVTPLQLASMVSTLANDGMYTPPRVVAGVLPPRKTPQTVTFQRPQQHRVISTMTAAQMRKMLEGVVLFGTGKRAILDGYTSAGKTGTAQKVDPSTGTYSRTKYVATFAGFAPVTNPALTIVVSLDSAVGLHQGGQISAPVFARIAQQALEYMNVPHDAEVKNNKRLLLRASAKDDELSEGSADHLGGGLEIAQETALEPAAKPAPLLVPAANAKVLTAKAVQQTPDVMAPPKPAECVTDPRARPGDPCHNDWRGEHGGGSGTVVLDVGGGVSVPSFSGKPLRVAIELAEEAGLELEALGSGVAREQSPAAGTRVPAGSRISVRFSR